MFGREGPEIDIVLADDSVSRRHAVIRQRHGRLLLQDLGSTNGTYLEGDRVLCAPLGSDNEICLGQTTLRVSTDQTIVGDMQGGQTPKSAPRDDDRLVSASDFDVPTEIDRPVRS